jgi:hypothetical protein
MKQIPHLPLELAAMQLNINIDLEQNIDPKRIKQADPACQRQSASHYHTSSSYGLSGPVEI